MTVVPNAHVLSRWGHVRWSWSLLVGVVVAALLAGCTSAGIAASDQKNSPGRASVIVSASRGGTLTAGGATLVIPAGAVSRQAIAHLQRSSASVLQAVTPNTRLILQPVGAAVEVDLSGQQPLQPLTLTLPVIGAGDHPALAVITNHQGTASVLAGIPSADKHSYTVKVSKLSLFQLVVLNPSAVLQTFTDGIKVALGTLGVYSDKPSCFGKNATLPDGRRVQVTGARGPLWPCVIVVGSNVTVTVHSVDPLPWQVRARAGDYAGAAEADSKAAVVQAIYAALASDRPNADGLVLPQDQGQWTVPVADLPVDMAGKVSTGAWLATTVVFSVLYLADVASGGQASDAKTLASGFQHAIGDKAAGWDCVVAAAKAAPDGPVPSPGQLAALLQAAVGCVGPLAKPVLGSGLGGLATLALDIVGGGAAVVVGGLEGALRTATGTDTTSWQVSVQLSGTCIAADLFNAAVAKEHFNPHDPGYQTAGANAGAYDPLCIGNWATASISRPNVGTTDGGTLFHRVSNGRWVETAAIEWPFVACALTKYGVPPADAVKLTRERAFSASECHS